MKVKCLKPFSDFKEKVERTPGEVFEVTKARAAELEEKLPEGYVEVLPEPKKKAKKKEE